MPCTDCTPSIILALSSAVSKLPASPAELETSALRPAVSAASHLTPSLFGPEGEHGRPLLHLPTVMLTFQGLKQIPQN